MNGLVIIPARGGSKGVPGKNLKLLNGKPLLSYPIETAKACKSINRIIVSTDDEEIAAYAISQGAEVIKRPPELSQDDSLVIDAIRYTLRELKKEGYEADVVLLLEATSPIRSVENIEEAIEIIRAGKADTVTTITETDTSPGRLWSADNNDLQPYIAGSNPFLPRQKQPVAYRLTGQIYAFTPAGIERDLSSNRIIYGKIYPIITDGSTALDIDTELDFLIAGEVLRQSEAGKN